MRFLLLTILILAAAGCATAPYTAPIKETYSIGGVYHTVRSGETLWRISKLYDVDLGSLVKANSIRDTDMLSAGQRLYIPGVHRKKEIATPSIMVDSFKWPLNGNVASFFGTRIGRVRNKGIDIHARMGDSVIASRAGNVVFCDDRLKGFGKTVILSHGDNYQTVYAYNSEILVKIGDAVEQNTVIARAGETGRAKEPGLHFEIRKDGEPQNPLYYLPNQ